MYETHNPLDVDIGGLKRGEVDLGTSIMAVKFAEGVVLGADSRTTTGASIANRVTDKLTQVYDKIWCCRSGSAADTQAINDVVQYYLSIYSTLYNREPTVQVAAALFQELCYSNKDRLSAGLIVAGYDPQNGAEVYHIPAGGSLHKQDFSIGGSGSTYIYGFCDANFKENMTRDEAIDFVKNALALAMSRDGSSGGVIRMMILTGDKDPERLFFAEPNFPKFWEKA